MTDDHISGLERLAKLKADGALSDSEYETQKARLIGGAVQPPFYRRLAVVVVLTVLILTMPLALLILATGRVFKKQDGAWTPISNKGRAIYAGVLVVWLAGAFVNAVLFPDGGVLGAIYGNKTPNPADTGVASSQSQAPAPAPAQPTSEAEHQSQAAPAPQQHEASSDGPPACTDPKFRQMVLEAIDNGFDKAGLPRAQQDEQAAGALIELDGPLALTSRRSMVANSNGEIKMDEIRICGTKDQNGDVGLVTVIVIQHDGEIGGGIQNTGLPTVIPFGKQF